MLDVAQAPWGVAVRLTLDEGNEPRFKADRVRSSDEVFHSEERVVLVVDEEVAARVADKRLVVDPEDEAGLLLADA